jgi:hypothetical protein
MVCIDGMQYSGETDSVEVEEVCVKPIERKSCVVAEARKQCTVAGTAGVGCRVAGPRVASQTGDA